MLSYAPVNLHRLSQVTPDKPAPAPGLPAFAVNSVIVLAGFAIGTLGYYNRKTDLGTLAIGAGSSIMGAGLVLLGLDLAGFRPRQF